MADSADSTLIPKASWFEALFGFKERDVEVREFWPEMFERLVNGDVISKSNGARFGAGKFSTPMLRELRDQARTADLPDGPLELTHVATKDIFEMHTRDEYRGALKPSVEAVYVALLKCFDAAPGVLSALRDSVPALLEAASDPRWTHCARNCRRWTGCESGRAGSSALMYTLCLRGFAYTRPAARPASHSANA